MSSIRTTVYLEVNGVIWALLPNGTLKPILRADVPEGAVIQDFLAAEIVYGRHNQADIVIDGVKRPIKLDDKDLPDNDGRAYFYEIARTNEETIAESGFDTSHQRNEILRPRIYDQSTNDWHHRDGALITIVIEDNDYPVGLDGYINRFEAPGVQLHGTTSNIDDDRIIIITVTDINGYSISFETMAVGGLWDLGRVDLSSLAEGKLTATAEVTDSFGVVISAVDDSIKDVLAEGETPTNVHLYDADEAHDATFSNTFTNVQTGAIVNVTVTDQHGDTLTYTTTLKEDGSWSLSGLDLSSLSDGEITVVATTVDQAGNPAEGVIVAELLVSPLITIEAIDNDGVINQYESPTALFQGTIYNVADGLIITVTITDAEGNNVEQEVVVNGGTWSAHIDVSSLADGVLTAEADVTNQHGDKANAETDIDLDQTAAIDVNFVDDDGVINAVEGLIASVTGGTDDVENRQLVEFTIVDSAGTTLTGTATVVDNAWIFEGLDFSSLAPGELSITAETVDVAGNKAEASNTIHYDPLASIDDITIINEQSGYEDDVINKFESELQTGTTFTGTSTEIEAGQTLSISITDSNGVILDGYTAIVAGDGSWTFDADVSGLADGPLTVTATGEDLAGNVATYQEDFLKDTQAEITIEYIQDDDYINHNEQTDVALRGTVTDVEDGATVTVVISDGDSSHDITVQTTVVGGIWQIDGNDISGLDETAVSGNRITATATVTDTAGNQATADTSIIKDTIVAIDIVTPVSGDDDGNGGLVVNNGLDIEALKNGETLTIRGTSDAEINQPVTIIFTDNFAESQSFVGSVIDASGNWEVTSVAVTALSTNASWELAATVSDIAGNYASDLTPIIELPETATIDEFGIAGGGTSSDTVDINTSGNDADPLDDYKFSETQTALETLTSADEATVLNYVSNIHIELKTTSGDLVLEAVIDPTAQTVTITQHRNIDHSTSVTIATQIMIETTQTDADMTIETVLAPIEVLLTDAPPIFVPTYTENTTEAIVNNHDLLADNTTLLKPARLYELHVDTDDDGVLDTIVTVPDGGSASVNTVKGQLTFYSDATWALDAARNLDHNNDQKLHFDYQLYDNNGHNASGSAVITILDGAQGSINDAEAELTEDILSPTASVVTTAALLATAGSDNVDVNALQFSSDSITHLEALLLTSSADALTYSLSVDGDTITAYVGVASNVIFSLGLTAAATADSTGNADIGVELTLFQPLDHIIADVITLPLLVIGVDTDGTPLIVGEANLVINDGPDPQITTPTTPNDISETAPTGSPIERVGSVSTDVGSDAIARVVFQSGDVFQSITSNGYALLYRVSSDGSLLEAYIDNPTPDNVIFSVQIQGTPDPVSSSTTDYLFSLYGSLDQISQPSDTLTLTLPIYVVDDDNDMTAGAISIDITDGVNPSIIINDDTLQISETPIDPVNAGVPSVITTQATVTAGSDRIVEQTFSITPDQPLIDTSGNPITQNGVALLLKFNGDDIIAYNPDTNTNIITFTLTPVVAQPDGLWPGQSAVVDITVEVVGSIDHISPDGNTEIDDISMMIPVLLTDSDGDEYLSDLTVSVLDGQDPVFASADPIYVSETGLGSRGNRSEKDTTQIQLEPHSDSVAQYIVLTDAFDALGLTSGGVPITMTLQGNVYRGKAGAAHVFAMTIDSEGLLTYLVKGPFDHEFATTNDLTFPIGIQAVDVDGDISPAAEISITVHDDVPVAVDDIAHVIEGFTTTGNVFSNDDKGVDVPTKIINLVHNSLPITFNAVANTWTFEIFAPDVVAAVAVFVLNENGSYELTSSVSDSESIIILNELRYTMQDFDGDTSEALVDITIEDSGFYFVPPANLENFEDSEFLLDLSFQASDVEASEVASKINIDASTVDGGRLFLDPAGGGARIELFAVGGQFVLEGALLDYDGLAGIAKPNGNLIYIPAEDISNANETLVEITPFADFKLGVTLVTSITGGGAREFDGIVDLSVISVADDPVWQDNGSAELDGNGNVTKYIVAINEDSSIDNLGFAAISVDNDGSEDVTYRMGAIDSEIIISIGTVVLAEGDPLTLEQLDQMLVKGATNGIAGRYNFNLISTTTEKDNLDTAEAPIVVDVDITPIADEPSISVRNVQSLEDQLIDLGPLIYGELDDPDGSETLTFELEIPTGWTVEVDGTPRPGTTVIVSYANLTAGLVMLRPEQDISSYDQEFHMQVTPIANESTQDGLVPSLTAHRGDTKDIRIDVKGVVDEPELKLANGWELVDNGGGNFSINNLPTNIGTEDLPIALDFLLGTSDNDSSEFSNILLTDIPTGAYFSDSVGNITYLSIVDFDSSNDPIFQVSATQLQNLFITPPEDFSGILNFTVKHVITEPDGDSRSYDIAVNVDIAPAVESSVEELNVQHVLEDGVLALNLKSGLKDIDGSEAITDVVMVGLPVGGTFIIEGVTVIVGASGEIRLSDHTSNITQTLDNNAVHYQPVEDFSGRFQWQLNYDIIDTAPGTGRTDAQTVTGSIQLDVHPVVEADTALVGSTGAINSTSGAVDLTGKVQFNEADIDGSEWLDTITIVLSNNEDYFVTHPNGAIHKGNGEWIIDATGLTSSSAQDVLAEITNGLIITSSKVGSETVRIEVRVTDQASAWHSDTPGSGNTLIDGKILFTEIDLLFNEVVPDGVACTPSALINSGEIIDGTEDVHPTDLGGHLNNNIAQDCDGLNNDTISFRILATDVAHFGWIMGPGVVAEYDASGDNIIAWCFTEAAVSTLELRHLEEDFAGIMDIPVEVIVTDASGDTLIDNSQVLKIEIAPVVDTFTLEVANNILVEEDIDTILGLHFVTEDSNLPNQGIESIDDSNVLTLTLLDSYLGTLSLPPSSDPALLRDDGGGVYTLFDSNLLASVRFRAPAHMDGLFRLQVEGKYIDVADGYGGDQIDSELFTREVVIEVEPVTDNVNISQTGALVGDEDDYISLSGITIALIDDNRTHEIDPENLPPGSSESITILIEDVPAGANLYYDNGNGTYTPAGNNSEMSGGLFSWKVDPSRVDDLVIKAAKDFSGDIDLTIKVLNYERGTSDYKTMTQVITIGVLPIADGSDAFAHFDDDYLSEGGDILIPLNADIIDDDTDGHETVVVRVNIAASSDATAYYQLVKVLAPDGTEAVFIDNGVGSDPRLTAQLEMTTQDLASISIITDPDAHGVLNLEILTGSKDVNVVGGSAASDIGGFTVHELSVHISAQVDPPVVDTDFNSIAGLEGDTVPLSLMLNMVNPAATELGSIEIKNLPVGYTIIGGTLLGGVWTVQEADVASADIVGGTNLFGDFSLEVCPIASLNGSEATGNSIYIDVHIAEVANTGPTQLDGTANDDIIYGNDDEQVIDAGAGNDTIASKGGSDTMTGGAGDNNFIFFDGDGNSVTPATDIITDFDTGGDTLDMIDFFAGQDLSTIALVDALIDFSYDSLTGTTLIIKDSGGNISENIVLSGVTEDQLYGGDASAATEAEILQKMIDDQTLVVNG